MIGTELGRSGLRVSRLGLSCMGFSLGAPQTAAVWTRREAIGAIRAACELGVTFFDTAAAYGPGSNEEMVGEAIAPFRRDVTVATKFGYRVEEGRVVALDSRPDTIRRSAEASLRRLGVDCIDVFMQQRVDGSVPIEDVAGAVRDLVMQGKVKHFGLCEPDAATVHRAHAVLPLSVVQTDYSVWNREAEGGLLDTLESLGIGLVSWNPLGQGYIANAAVGTEASLRANRALLARLGTVADRHGATLQQVAAAWLTARRPWIVPLLDTTDLTSWRHGSTVARLRLTDSDLETMSNPVSVGVPRRGRFVPVSGTPLGGTWVR